VSTDHLQSTFLRLRPDSSIEKLPVDERFWPALTSGRLGNFHHEYLVTSASYTADWPGWERHPAGDEIVCLLGGEATLLLEEADGTRPITLAKAGDFAFVPRGIWHTGRVASSATLLFITAGEGTETRPATG
jgi:mannose-6-phosphate isomerase-like protein (cupin superfamily)